MMRARLLALVLLAACGGTAEFAFEIRGPQVALIEPTSALIAFRSRLERVGSLEYGESQAYGTRLTDAAPGLDHVFRLQGLLPGTLYHYRIRLNGRVESEGHAFRTADPLAPFRFVVFGDTGGGDSAQRDIAVRANEADPDLAILTGDLIYDSGKEIDLDPLYFRPYKALIDHVPFYASLGNHDVLTENGRPFLDAVYLPGDERTYSFDRGNAHFVALDTNGDLAAQAAWLDADLAAAQATWTFVFFHHPPWSSSAHGGELAVRAEFGPVFDRYGVDIVFAGHDHDYERTFPIFADGVVDAQQDPDYAAPGGTVYVVTGGGGKGLYASGTSSFTAYSESAFHFVRVDVDGPSLELSAIDRFGQPIDRMTLAK